MKDRILKTQPMLRRNAYRRTKVVPSLTMSGNWMIEAGFIASMKVNVIVEPGKITIQPAA